MEKSPRLRFKNSPKLTLKTSFWEQYLRCGWVRSLPSSDASELPCQPSYTWGSNEGKSRLVLDPITVGVH